MLRLVSATCSQESRTWSPFHWWFRNVFKLMMVFPLIASVDRHRFVQRNDNNGTKDSHHTAWNYIEQNGNFNCCSMRWTYRQSTRSLSEYRCECCFFIKRVKGILTSLSASSQFSTSTELWQRLTYQVTFYSCPFQFISLLTSEPNGYRMLYSIVNDLFRTTASVFGRMKSQT